MRVHPFFCYNNPEGGLTLLCQHRHLVKFIYRNTRYLGFFMYICNSFKGLDNKDDNKQERL